MELCGGEFLFLAQEAFSKIQGHLVLISSAAGSIDIDGVKGLSHDTELGV